MNTPESVIYGFPLNAGMEECIRKLAQEMHPQTITGQVDRAIKHVEDTCKSLWPHERTEVILGYDDRHRITNVLALAASRCASPNDELIPQSDDMQKLRNLLANEGFKEPPMWFTCSDGFVHLSIVNSILSDIVSAPMDSLRTRSPFSSTVKHCHRLGHSLGVTYQNSPPSMASHCTTNFHLRYATVGR